MSVAEELLDATKETLKKAENRVVEASLALEEAAGNIVSGIKHLKDASPSEKAELIEGGEALIDWTAGALTETEDPNEAQDLREIANAVHTLAQIGRDSKSSHPPDTAA
ncbi:MAG: hypothetical protein H6855_07195 [Rhodospirillales bacterium]|nr:hypothetical protein [Rhodospirillales bacterium]MCB9979654.1 hypothetical protein [Rhodospirillales bacterium]